MTAYEYIGQYMNSIRVFVCINVNIYDMKHIISHTLMRMYTFRSKMYISTLHIYIYTYMRE